MNLAVSLLIAQTIVLSITAIIVLWYTIETYKIRKETSKQNAILTEQYLIQKKKEEFQLNKEINFIEPIFRPTHSSVGKTDGTCNFVNNGSLIKKISVEPTENYLIIIHPKNYLNTGEKGRIVISRYPTPTPQLLHFKIKYENKLGLMKEKYFKYITKDAMFEEVEKV
jgi:hypothetical protein